MSDDEELLKIPQPLDGVEYGELFKRIKSEETRKNLKTLQKKLRTYLIQYIHFFPTFTGHDYEHSLRTLSNLEALLSIQGILDEIAENQENLILLICACLIHDVGMGPVSKKELDRVRNRKFKMTLNEQNKIRLEHHDRVYDWICESSLSENIIGHLGLSEGQRKIIGHIARAHRKVKFFVEPFFQKTEHLDYAFFGAALRLADQMDLHPDRVEGFGIDLDFIGKVKDADTQRELLINIAKKSIYIIPQKRELVLKSKAPLTMTMKALHALDFLTMKVEEAVGEVRDVPWRGETILPRALTHQFGVEGLEKGYNPQLRSDYRSVWTYLSRELYSPRIRDEVPIREAVANAIDAGLLLELVTDETAHVVVRDEGDAIVIEDNGLGINHDVIENHLKVLGSSYYSSPKFQGWLNTHNWVDFSVIGRFGIGAFSYLLTSGNFTIDTVTQHGEAHRILFTERFGVAKELPKGVDLLRGTRVRIPCKVRPKSWSTKRDFKNLLHQLFPRPSIKLSLVSDRKVKPIQIGHFERKGYSRITQNPKSCSVIFEDWKELENKASIGFSFKMSMKTDKIPLRMTLLRLLLFYTDELKLLSSASAVFSGASGRRQERILRSLRRKRPIFRTFSMWRGAYRPRDIGLYNEGMAITAILNDQSSLIYALSMLSSKNNYDLFEGSLIRRIGTDANRFWIDLKSHMVKLELTKKSVHGFDSAPYLEELDILLKPYVDTILTHKKIPWILREYIRHALLVPFEALYIKNKRTDFERESRKIVLNELVHNYIDPKVFLQNLPVWDIDSAKLRYFGSVIGDNKTKTVSVVPMSYIYYHMAKHTTIDWETIWGNHRKEIEKIGLGDYNLVILSPWEIVTDYVRTFLTSSSKHTI